MIEFYWVENIKSITIFNSIVNALGRIDIPLTDRKVRRYDGQGLINLENLGNFFFRKKGSKNFSTPYSILFLSVSHQNKALDNFHK